MIATKPAAPRNRSTNERAATNLFPAAPFNYNYDTTRAYPAAAKRTSRRNPIYAYDSWPHVTHSCSSLPQKCRQPQVALWPNRDPLGELGAILLKTGGDSLSKLPLGAYDISKSELNSYSFAFDDSIDWFDVDGRSPAKPSSGSSATPAGINRAVRTATPAYPRCASFCGYGCIGILLDLTITDSSGAPISGLSVSESISAPSSSGYFNFKPRTGTATTDSKGMISDMYYACFYSTAGFVSINQTITAGGLSATFSTALHIGPCSWTGNMRVNFK